MYVYLFRINCEFVFSCLVCVELWIRSNKGDSGVRAWSTELLLLQ